MITAEWKELL